MDCSANKINFILVFPPQLKLELKNLDNKFNLFGKINKTILYFYIELIEGMRKIKNRLIKAYKDCDKRNFIPPVVEQCNYNMMVRYRVESEYRDLLKNIKWVLLFGFL